MSFLITLAAYDAGSTAYHFILLSDASAPSPEVAALIGSFRLLSAAEAGRLRARSIDTVAVRPGDTPASLGARMAGAGGAAHFLMLNGREEGDTLRPGEPVKVVIYGR